MKVLDAHFLAQSTPRIYPGITAAVKLPYVFLTIIVNSIPEAMLVSAKEHNRIVIKRAIKSLDRSAVRFWLAAWGPPFRWARFHQLLPPLRRHPVIRYFQQDIGMARLVYRTPTSKVLAFEGTQVFAMKK
jgi:hypothetical protein